MALHPHARKNALIARSRALGITCNGSWSPDRLRAAISRTEISVKNSAIGKTRRMANAAYSRNAGAS